MKKKIIVALLILIIAAGSASAFNFMDYGAGIKGGDLMVNVAGTFGDSWTGLSFGAVAAIDWALPLPLPLTVGLEAGALFLPKRYGNYEGMIAIPIIARIAWHFDLGISNFNLDPYILLKVGYALGFVTDPYPGYQYEMASGIIYGFNIGARWFFNDSFGIYLEAGYEYDTLSYRERYQYYSGWGSWYWRYHYTNRFATLGVTFKL